MQLINLYCKQHAGAGMRAEEMHGLSENQFVIPRVRSKPVRQESVMWRQSAAFGVMARDGKESPAEESTITIGSDRQVVGAPSAV